MKDTLLSLRDIRFAYRARPVLHIPRWEFGAGEQWACLGPNGAGKTTLARILSGELHCSSGEIQRGNALAEGGAAYVCFEQQKILCERDQKLDDSHTRADANDPGTTVAAAAGIGEADPVAAHWAARLGIDHILERGIRFVSTGELRKTLLLGAILSRPALLILDSPLDGLDRRSRGEMSDILDELLGSELRVFLLARKLEALPRGITHVLALEAGGVLAAGKHRKVLRDKAVKRLMSPPLPPLAPLPERATPPAPPPANEPLLELKQVSVRYGDVQVLDRVDWTFRPGRHCAVSGPNGCGKTTLLSLINGDNHKAYGQNITLFGRRRGSGESVWDIKRKFGWVDTKLHLGQVRGMTALEVVVSGFFDTIGLYDEWGGGQRQLARRWLAALGIGELEHTPFDTLSFGMQRMVMLARAMVKFPPILVLDEPCLGLDGYHTGVILRAVDHIAASSATQIVFVSHEAGETPDCINQWLEFVPEGGGFSLDCREQLI